MSNKEVIDVVARFSGDIANINKAISQIESRMEKTKLAPNIEKDFLNKISKIQNELSNFETKAKAGVASMADSKALEKSGQKIIALYNQLFNQIKVIANSSGKSFESFFPEAVAKNIKEADKAVQSYEQKHINIEKQLEENNKALEEQLKLQKKLTAEKNKIEKIKPNIKQSDYDAAKSGLSAAKGARTKAINKKTLLEEQIASEVNAGHLKLTKSGNLDKRFSANAEYIKSLEEVNAEIEKADEKYKVFEKTLSGKIPPSQINKQLEEVGKSLTEVDTKIKRTNSNIVDLNNADDETFKDLLTKLKEIEGIDLNSIKGTEKIKEIKEAINAIETKQINNAKEPIEQMGQAAESVEPDLVNLRHRITEVGEETKELTDHQKDIDNLRSSLVSFFSVGNTVQLFKKAIASSFETVKELDATMTEAAVVTDFSVGDMWDKLPQYSVEATRLGVSINDLYGATTLYLQQGLKMEQAMEVGVETMKMARIAGMDSSEATQAMTAALRGFNMEINNMSAEKVNDVYSKLAAITAADTSQIATAMSKTASIASSANMEFETTAAFLSQIIETTQEAPETAGTALKTIIARFSEVKKLASEGQATGTDEEGELINVNNIQKALRTVGISMDDFFKGKEGLDSVLLKLAEKWKTLDFETQRYIATTAAGSRQQSRFIAMMSDYDRTMELVNAANNSAGASQEQFNKTLDSLESKLNQLNNAWNQFTMGLANNEVIKFGVDSLTLLLDTVNNLLTAFSGNAGLTKAILSFGATWGGLKLGGKILGRTGKGGILSSLFGKDPEKTSQELGKKAKKGFFNGFKKKGKNLFSELFTSGKDEESLKKAQLKFDEILSNSKLSEDKLSDVINTNENSGLNAAIKQAKQYGVEIDKATVKNAKFASAAQLNMNAVGVSIAGLGMGVNALSGLFEEGTEAQKIFKNLGSTLTIVGSTLPMLASGAKAVGLNFTTAGIQGSIAGASVQIAWLPVLAILGAIIAAAAAYVNITNEAQKNSLANRIEEAAQRTAAAKETAEKTKEAYDQLLSENNKYTELQSTLENLTKGTREWKQALLEANTQVLNLLTTYPELAQYINRGENGQLIISNKGWDEVFNAQEERVKSSYSNSLISQINESNLKVESAKEKAKLEGYFDQDEKLLSNLMALFHTDPKQFIKNEDDRYGEQLEKLADTYHYTADELANTRDQLLEYDAALVANQTTVSNLSELYLDENLKDSKYKEQLVTGFSHLFGDSFSDEVERRANDLANSHTNVTQRMKDLGLVDTGDKTKNLQLIYSKLNNIQIEDIPDYLKNNNTALAKEIVTMEVAKEKTSTVNDFASRLEKLDPKYANEIANLLSRNYNKFSVNEAGRVEVPNSVLKFYKDLGYSSEQSMAEALDYQNTSFTNLTEEQKLAWARKNNKNATDLELLERISNGEFDDVTINASEILRIDDEIFAQQLQQTWDKASAVLKSKGIGQEFYRTKDIDTIQNLSNQIVDMSKEDAQKYVAEFNNVISNSNLGEGKKEKLENYLSTVDWTDMTQAIDAIDYLQSMGIDTEEIENFWEVATEGANTYISSLEEALSLMEYFRTKEVSNSELMERITEGTATQSDLEKLISMGADVSGFDMTVEGYRANTGDLAAIEQLLSENAQIQHQNVIEQQKQQTEENRLLLNSLYKFVNMDVNGEYSVGNNINESNVDVIASKLGMSQEIGELEEEYITRVKQALQDLVNAYNAGDDVLSILENTSTLQLTAEAERSGVDSGVMLDQAADLEKQGIAKQQAEELALANAKLNQGYKEIAESYDDWTALIDENTGIIKTNGTEDIEVFENLKVSMNKMLNVSDDLSETFWNNAENIKLIKSAAEGDMEALENLQKAASADYLMQIGAEADTEEAANAIFTLSDYILSTDLPELEAGATLDNTDFINRCNELIAAAGMTSEEVAKAFQALGYDVEITEETVFRKIPIYSQEQVVVNSDGTTTVHSMPPQIIGYDNIPETFPVIKTLTSTGSGGGGISTSNSNTSKGNKKSSGGGSSKSKKHKNSYDKYYNTNQKIDEEIRDRNKLERDYDNLLKNRKLTLDQIRKNQLDQIASLKKEIDYQKQLVAGRKEQLNAIAQEKYMDSEGNEKTYSALGVTKYAKYDQQAGVVVIDWEAINKVTDEEEGAAIESYISRLEELSGQLEESEDAIWKCEDEIEQIKNQNKESFLELEQRVYDALVKQEQQKIDEYKNLTEAISEANNELLQSVRESIDLERQIRDNTKKEEEIRDKENRLAYLRMDTSGASDLEIKKLEEELFNARESYQDTVIDQKLADLEKDSQNAQEQREKQIELMQAQLDYQAENGEFWGRVQEILDSAFNSDGSLNNNSALVELLKQDEAFGGLSEMGKEKWIEELVEEFITGMNGFESWKLDKAKNNNSTITFADGQKATYNATTGKWENGQTTFEGVAYDAERGSFIYNSSSLKQITSSSTTSSGTTDDQAPKLTTEIKKGVAAAIWNGGYGWGGGKTRESRLKEVFGDNDIQSYVDKKNFAGDPKKYSYELMRKQFKGYKTGGLADFTGPAWLDGTKSKPEIVLNAQDSKNFIVLKDILSSLMNEGKTSERSSGDNYFDIQINVDELSNDYDVDQLAERIKKQIYDDSVYRNVNSIKLLR